MEIPLIFQFPIVNNKLMNQSVIKPQLFLLHFAGGNQYSYTFLNSFLIDFELIPLELPGRGRRIKEELLIDIDTAANDLYCQIISRIQAQKFMIFGHSMGAYLALKVADLLERSNNFPSYLFVSGAPGTAVNIKKRHLLDDADFISELKKMGGIPNELIKNKDFIDFYLPILRSDFKIIEGFEMEKQTSLNTSIFALMGDKEENTNQISKWKNYTRSFFKYRILSGEHFFIYKNAVEISKIIKDSYAKIDLF